MAFGRNQRFDSRKSSSYCSSATLVVFVALCLVGVWMMTSSTVVPIQLITSEKSEVTVISNRLEDLPGDSSEVTKQQDVQTKGDSTVEYNASENSDDKFDIQIKGETEDSVNTPKSQTYNDVNGTAVGGEVARTVDNMDNDLVVQKKGQGKAVSDDQSSNGTVSNDQLQPDRDKNFTESQLDDSDNENNAEEAAGDKNKLESKRNSVGTDKSSDDAVQAEQDPEQIKENDEENRDIEPDKADLENTTDSQLPKEEGVKDVFPDGAQLDLLNETNTLNGASWSTQAAESKNEKDVQASSSPAGKKPYSWKLCNATAAADYIPCLDNEEAIKKLRSTKHYEHRERHCPEESPVCLVPLPKGYCRPIYWPNSRDKIWYSNVPHTQLAEVKGHQNWVKVSGEHLVFPGGGTQFKNGALHYIDFIQESMPDISWGKHSRVVLDVGCGVASFGGYLFDRDTLTMSFAPKDEHEAQVQFALERGIPAISAVMGTSRLPFPSRVFDLVHCARCRVPWHAEGGMLLLELNRLLRPGGHFVWSATPVYRKTQEDMEIWNAMSALTESMCWEMVAKRRDVLNEVGLAIFRKPLNNSCYEERKPPLCHESDNPNAAWNIGLQRCIHKLPSDPLVRGSQWPEEWPLRLEAMPYWLNHSLGGVYGKPASNDFLEDYMHWKKVVGGSYSNGMGIHWPAIRNVMDMRSVYGGFGAALSESKKVWVMNVVSIDSPDTLPVIYERGLFGIYHDWCESFSSYPRTYDLIHADHLFSTINDRCKMEAVFVEVDRLLRPEGKLIVRDSKETANKLQDMAESLHWEVCMAFAEQDQAILCLHKTAWRPDEVADS